MSKVIIELTREEAKLLYGCLARTFAKGDMLDAGEKVEKIIMGQLTEDSKEEPYIKETVVDVILKYNTNYGDNKICECGHPYYRHFDTYEDMYAIGCKYCRCNEFKEVNE